ncbi:LexA family protein [Streptomyces sp. NPDC051554]|uniref:LexA family protein n=1 Tax=Streptomyces sp. NPDC051554 TaxID=3365656 RepID=UPI00379B8E3C
MTFPLDLIQAQRDWNLTYAALERRPGEATRLRRRLQTLSVRLTVHPFWDTEAGKNPSARVALRQRVRELEAIENDLTDVQQQILKCIRAWVADHGEAPTLRQIAEEVGLSSTGSITYQINRLEQLGVLARRDKGRGVAVRW